MIIYLCGAHGVGKTTLVNKILLDEPIIKVVNIDYSRKFLNGRYAKNQFLRYKIYFDTMKRIVKNKDALIILDRSPESMKFYTETHHELGLIKDSEYKKLMRIYNLKLEKYKNLLNKYQQKEFRIYLRADENFIIDNIKRRCRDKTLKEDDKDYLKKIIEKYESFFGQPAQDRIIVELRGDKSEAYRLAEEKIKEIINENLSSI